MKILIITAAWNGGGAEAVARESYTYYVNSKEECYFAFARGNIPSTVNYIKIGNKFDYLCHVINARLFDNNGFVASSATRKLIEDIERIRPDIIQIHNIVCYVINIRILFEYLKSSKIPVVWTLHDCWAFTGHCIFFTDVSCNKWSIECGKCPGKKEYPKSLLFDNSKRNLQEKKRIFSGIQNMVLVTPSNWLAGIVKQTYLKQYKIFTIPNGINVNNFHPVNSNIKSKYSIGNRKVILGVANRWTMRKGLKYFCQLSEIIDVKKYQIVLVGIDEKTSRKLPDNILAIDRTSSSNELAKWYTVSDVFVNLSIADNFPTVNLEALACGTPVVTFNTGGSWESVGSDCGELITCRQPENIYKAIEACISRNIPADICVRQSMKYCREDRYKDYLKLYKDLLGK